MRYGAVQATQAHSGNSAGEHVACHISARTLQLADARQLAALSRLSCWSLDNRLHQPRCKPGHRVVTSRTRTRRGEKTGMPGSQCGLMDRACAHSKTGTNETLPGQREIRAVARLRLMGARLVTSVTATQFAEPRVLGPPRGYG